MGLNQLIYFNDEWNKTKFSDIDLPGVEKRASNTDSCKEQKKVYKKK